MRSFRGSRCSGLHRFWIYGETGGKIIDKTFERQYRASAWEQRSLVRLGYLQSRGLSTIECRSLPAVWVVFSPGSVSYQKTAWRRLETSRQLVAQMKTSDQMQIDFAASMVNETDKTSGCKYGFVMPADGTGIPSVETLKAEMIQSGLDETMTQSGMITLGTNGRMNI